MGKTSIEWTDESWPIVNGCRRASPGCVNCYAERLACTRLKHLPKYRGLAVYGKGWTGESRLWEPDLDMPLRLRKPSRIFVADMGDLFYEGVPDALIDRVWATMLLAPQHTFQVLTKRAARMRAYLTDPERYARVVFAAEAIRRARPKLTGVAISNPTTFPAPWIWLGVSVEDQKRADERIPELLATPAAVRFLSCEPLLGPVDVARWMWPVHERWPAKYRTPAEARTDGAVVTKHRQALVSAACRFVDWVIVGSESGPGARPMAIEWATSLRDQCSAAGVACFTKQIATPEGRARRDAKGGDPQWWPGGPSAWPREMPEPRHA